MTIGDAYTRWATTYDTDRNRTRDLDRMTTEILLGDNYYDKVLEIGCGTGKNTMKESWHHEDEGKSPRLVSLMFEKAAVREN